MTCWTCQYFEHLSSSCLHHSLQPLLPCTRSQQCFTTATIRSFGHFEHLELPLSLYCDVAFTRCEQQISGKIWTKQRVLAVMVITKKNCLRIFAASMRVISAMSGTPLLSAVHGTRSWDLSFMKRVPYRLSYPFEWKLKKFNDNIY